MASLFISYSRRDIEVARKLTGAFKGQDLDFWIDWEGIPPTVDWWKEIEKGIEVADIFLFLLSPDSAASSVCRREIEHAANNGKRLIPLVVREVKASDSPPELRHLNWIFLRESDDFHLAFGKMITAIKTDYAWVQVHRQLQVKALEWERSAHKNAFLLHGEELQEAEYQLATNSSKEPHPTDLQREYVLRSRQASDRQRRILTGSAIAAAIVMLGLAIFGFDRARVATANAEKEQTASTLAVSNANTAEANAEVALARQLAAQALLNLEVDPERSILLALQAASTTYRDGNKTVVQEVEYALHQAVQASHVRLTLTGHRAEVNGVVFSPDGQWLATTSADQTAKVWDASTGQELFTLKTGHTHIPGITTVSIVFSPSGTLLATVGAANTIKVWDMTTQQELYSLEGHTAQITGLAFSQDGERLVSGGFDSTIKIWDTRTGQQIISMPAKDDIIWKPIWGIALSPDGQQVASADQSGGATIWDAHTGIELLQLPHTGNVLSVAFSPDGTRLATADLDSEPQLWDLRTGQEILTLEGHENSIYSLDFSPDGSRLATAGQDRMAKVWDLTTGKELFTLAGHTDAILAVAFSPDGSRLATASRDTTVRLWTTIPDQELMTIPGDGEFRYSPDGERLAAVSDGRVRIWSTRTGQELLSLSKDASPIRTILFDADGSRLAAGTVDGVVIIWSADTGQELLVRSKNNSSINGISFNPEGTIIAAAYWDRSATIWDATTGEELLTLPVCECLHPSGAQIQGGVWQIAFSPDGRQLVTLSVDNALRIWDLNTGQKLRELQGYFGSRMVFSPDGKYLANYNKVWDAQSGQEKFTLTDSSISDIVFSPNGELMATSSSYETAKVWDMAAGQPLVALTGHAGAAAKIAFYAEGQKLITNSYADHTVRLWNTATGEEILAFKGFNIDLGRFALQPAETHLAIAGSDGTIGIYALRIEDLMDLARSRLTRTWTLDECKKYLQTESCPPKP